MKRQRAGKINGLDWRLATLEEVLGIPSTLWRYHLWNSRGGYIGNFPTYRDMKRYSAQVSWKTGTISEDDFTEVI